MISFKLNPKTGCEIYRDGQLIEVCTLAQKNARLAAHGHKGTKSPRYGFSQNGAIITKRGK